MVPLTPKGATIHSVIAASNALRLSVVTRWSERDLLFGRFDPEIKKHPSVQAIGLGVAIKMHTTLPILASFLDPSGRSVLLNGAIDGELSKESDFFFQRIIPTRRCPECVRDDKNRYGFAYTRVIHQIHFTRTCHMHECALEEVCDVCEQPYSYLSSVAGPHMDVSRCHRCGAGRGRSMAVDNSTAYRSCMRLAVAALNAEETDIGVKRRWEDERDSMASLENIGLKFISAFAHWWDISDVTSLASRFGLSPRGLQVQLMSIRRRSPNLILALAAFHSENARRHSQINVGDFCFLPERESLALGSDDLYNALKKLCEQFGHPLKTASVLATGGGITQLRAEGLSADFARLDLALPPALQKEITLRRCRKKVFVRTRIPDAVVLEAYKTSAMEYRQGGYATRAVLQFYLPRLAASLRELDLEWYESNFPINRDGVPKSSRKERRERMAFLIATYLRDGPSGFVKSIEQRDYVVWEQVIYEDREWLDGFFSELKSRERCGKSGNGYTSVHDLMNQGGTREQIRSRFREVLLLVRRAGRPLLA